MKNINSIVFGFACIADGMVRVLSLGFVHVNIALYVAREQARRRFTAKQVDTK